MLTHALTAPRVQPDAPRGAALGHRLLDHAGDVRPRERHHPREERRARERRASADDRRRSSSRKATRDSSSVLRANGASPTEARSIVQQLLASRLRDAPLKEGSRVKLLFDRPPTASAATPLLRVIGATMGKPSPHIAAVDDRNVFVSVAPPQTESCRDRRGGRGDRRGQVRRPAALDSLYETGFKHDIPQPILDQVIKIGVLRFRLQRRVSGGDSFEVFYAEDEENETIRTCSMPRSRWAAARSITTASSRATTASVDFFDEDGAIQPQVPHPQADLGGHPAVDLRHALPPHPALLAHAHRHRLGQQGRHADHRGRRRAHPVGGLGVRLWPPRRDRAPLQLRDDLQPHVGLRAGHPGRRRGCGRARSSAISAAPASRRGRICTTRS